MGNGTAVSDGDVYVLSVPSFQWVRVHEAADIRIKHKCQLAGKHTMLMIGGTVPRDTREYEPIEINCDSDTFANGVGIFDLRSHTWLSNYDAEDDEDYTINSDISDVIGGGYVLPLYPFPFSFSLIDPGRISGSNKGDLGKPAAPP